MSDQDDDAGLPSPVTRRYTPVQGTPVPVLAPERSGPVDVRRLRMSVTMTVTILIACCGAILTVGGAWSAISAHSANHAVHADEVKSLARGGVAYSNDVKELVAAEGAKTRELIKSMKINCEKKAGEFTCKVTLE